MASVAYHTPQCTLVTVAEALPRQLLVVLHGATHRCLSQLRQLTKPRTADTAETKHGQWSIQEERDLISYLSNHKAETGDGANFKQAVWTQAATYMSTLHPNVKFGANQCSSKWGRVHQYSLSQCLTNCYSIA